MLRHLPNLLSGFRLLAAPLAAWAVLAAHDAAALMIFAGASFSDLADGYVARRWGFTSQAGAWLDPLADKLLMLFCFLALWKVGAAPFWLVVLVIARDLVIGAGAVLAKALSLPLRIEPLTIGKATTAVLVLYAGILLLLLALDQDAPRLVKAGSYTAALFVVLSAAIYLYSFLRALLSGRRTA
ncbi:MAG: CDP-alcohol phosphatidyltransferase family protein [Alphaproteobacteria bacterium]|nr:CDP-alcohol phosphatidyltransferase family protein [Alphaproteobacteria bacterium]